MLSKKIFALGIILLVFLFVLLPSSGWAKPSNCEDCHVKLHPDLVKDFNRGKMSQKLTCKACHGSKHKSIDDIDRARLPTISTCKRCHPRQARQYLSGKHSLGLLAITAFPDFAHQQPQAFIAGQKGCNGCHNLGITNKKVRTMNEARKYYRYGMDCQNCHTRHAFSKKEALRPEACNSCHTGFDHAQWEMWTHSKHGSTYLSDRNAHRGPTCQDCHMAGGNHKVMTAWGFLALRLPEKDKEWMGYRATILKALGVLDKNGKPTPRLNLVKAANLARLDEKTWKSERERMKGVCKRCHSDSFASANLKNADMMIKASDRIFAQAINIVANLYRDGIIKRETNQATFPYPDLLTFYEVKTPIEQDLYEMFMDYRMKTYQAAFHIMPDDTTWYGYAKMKKTLVEMKAMDKQMRCHARKRCQK